MATAEAAQVSARQQRTAAAGDPKIMGSLIGKIPKALASDKPVPIPARTAHPPAAVWIFGARSGCQSDQDEQLMPLVTALSISVS
jgi:hypothetical protein